MYRFLIALSGGTTQVINTSLSGFLQEAYKIDPRAQFYYGVNGIDGIIKGNINRFDIDLINNKFLDFKPGSSFTGSSRIDKLSKNDINKFDSIILKYGITHFINIGGSGTIKQTIDISSRCNSKIIYGFIPKTIDNDLGDEDLNLMYFNPGFPSAVKVWEYFINALNIENLGAQQHDQILISQVFGRETGWLTAACDIICKRKEVPSIALIPENYFDLTEICNLIDTNLSKYGRLLIFITEGYPIGNIDPIYDHVGQIKYGSSGVSNSEILSSLVQDKMKISSRYCNPTILQRQLIFEKHDLDFLYATLAGKSLAQFFYNNKNLNGAVIINKSSNGLFECNTIKLEDIPKSFSRNMSKFITKDSNWMGSYDSYLKSLHL